MKVESGCSTSRAAALCWLVAALWLAVVAHADDFSLATAFTYQGRLEQKGRPANGLFDLTFELYDAAEGGTFLGRIDHFDQRVREGWMTAELDFGRHPVGASWLEIHVRPAGDGGYTRLEPRQALATAKSTVCTVDSDVQINGDLSVALGQELRVGNAITHLRLGSGGIQNQGLGSPDLLINPAGGDVAVGRSTAAAPLHLVGSPDAEPGSGGALLVGNVGGANLAFDSNEIMARNNGSVSTLYLNADGGTVAFGGAIDIGYEIVSHTENDDSVTIHCPPGKKVLGGGCFTQDFFGSADVLIWSYPANNGWICLYDDSDDSSATAFAICASVQ